ncbi:universal stress protein [Weizmannia coagulans]|jgi:nucleotide-binding universal stress UspA family protein|uniref:Universal stress protein n=3 Tax=Heyndrickxia TaxID=2837504 RepID=G2TPF2_HEYCO|nr:MULTISPECIES: universal stress protein [Heyndrickxia]NWN94279.1 universal stress protein [Bacillus sp. (in: firmicutes)]AEH54041.1 UspA domain protein [Heyndrickxia coagulans 2-6]AEP01681.1 UspA domain-containing protein [Heyndrickxia coagulans 36D1]AJO22255.1 UspA domain-containing protein [Heyndrickxia coagulans]AKN56210.1 Universal stress protein family [Heyndrickxia coagulans]
MGTQYRNILVAVDGSKEADWAFTKAVEIAKRNGAELSVVHVVDNRALATLTPIDSTLYEQNEKFGDELLSNYKDRAAEKGIKVQTIIQLGSPKLQITKNVAPKVHADLIVCGATGLNAVERLLIGSVSEHIVRTSPCDVLVVRTPKEEEGKGEN